MNLYGKNARDRSSGKQTSKTSVGRLKEYYLIMSDEKESLLVNKLIYLYHPETIKSIFKKKISIPRYFEKIINLQSHVLFVHVHLYTYISFFMRV